MFIKLVLFTILKGISASLPTCNITIVETIPQYVTYESTAFIAPPIWVAWKDLIENAQKYVRINSLYWSLLGNDTKSNDSSVDMGNEIFSTILEKSKNVKIQINHDIANASCNDMNILKKYKNINVSLINVTRLAGSGIQHSKLIIADGKKAFVGSANMDWRSLSQIKEVGAYITNCDNLVRDLDAFWLAINQLSGTNSHIPSVWPKETWPAYNMSNPFKALVNGIPMSMYTASSPVIFNPPHRASDLVAILNTIKEAKKYILISVMDFLPLIVNYKPHGIDKYWPDIESAILTAAFDRHVEVKMLISLWKHSDESNVIFLKSLIDLAKKTKFRNVNLKVKMFIIPAFDKFQRELPFARVSHSKYMVTDSTMYIGTNNWSGNYFIGTVGLSFVAKENCGLNNCGPKSIRQTLQDIFFVDWNSIYAHNL